MRVLLLSPYPLDILRPIMDVIRPEDDCDLFGSTNKPDITIMWGWRKILKPEEIKGRRIINIHQSYLPWNRGASPNLWSWYDDTPKGVSIHEVDEGIDTGPILARRIVGTAGLDEPVTLRTFYDRLQECAVRMFQEYWPLIRNHPNIGFDDANEGSHHTVIESNELMRHFPLGWDTPVKDVVEFGREQRERN